MNKALLNMAAAFCLVTAGSLCFYRFACDRPSDERSGRCILPAADGEYLEGAALSTDLQTRLESTLRRLQTKDAVLNELLAGRLTLLEAAARFGELDAGLPDTRDHLLKAYPGVPYQVALCRQVISYARAEMRLRAPEQMESVVARLEAELQAPLES